MGELSGMPATPELLAAVDAGITAHEPGALRTAVLLGLGIVALSWVVVATQTVVTLAFSDAAGASVPNVGASGAIAGVLGAYFVILPKASVLTAFIFFFVLLREIPAIWFLGFWFLLQLVEGGFSVVQPQSGGGTAFFAHIGGFVFGLVTIRFLVRRPPLQPAW